MHSATQINKSALFTIKEVPNKRTGCGLRRESPPLTFEMSEAAVTPNLLHIKGERIKSVPKD